VTQDQIPDMPEFAHAGRSSALLDPRHVGSSPAAYAPNHGATWPNTYQHPHNPAVTQLSGLATHVMHPEMPRIPFPDKARWLVHLVPSAFGLLVDASAMWANAEPDHALFTAIPVGIGTAAAIGAVVATVAGNLPARSDIDARDFGATRLIAGGSVALLSVGAMTGAGVSGIGALGGVACLGGLNVAWAGFLNWRRGRNQGLVVALAEAAANQPHPPAPGPGPVHGILEYAPPAPTNPYEARTLAALEAMGYAGAAAGPPKAIGEDAWTIRVALPKGRNTSPDKLVVQAEVLASNMEARRVEVEAGGGNFINITAFDGPDTLGPEYLYPWDNATIESLNDPMAIAIDEAGRPLKITINDHLLISGKTGGGKSKLVRQIVARTLGAKDTVRIGIDCKPGAVELGMFEPAMHFLAKTPLDAVRAHHGLKALIVERGKILEEHGDDTWRPEYGHKILVASDERAVVTRAYPEAGELIEENMQMGRFVDVRFADVTQTPSGSVYGKKTDGRHQYGIRIGFYNESTVNTMVFGGKASSEGWRLERLENAPGKMLIRCYGHNVPRPYKSLWAERDEILELIGRYDGQYPELDARSAAAFAAGMDAFDEAEEDASPEPPSGRRRQAVDPVDVAQDFYYGRPRLVPTYPDGSVMPDARKLLWDAVGEFPDGFTYRDVVALDLPGYAARTSIQTPLDIWRAKGWVKELRRDGNAVVYVRCADPEQPRRKEA
jgi:hypothetical protein